MRIREHMLNALRSLIKKICEILKKHRGSIDDIKIHDFGVNDGRTSVNFFHKVYAQCPKIEFTASDYNLSIKILEKGGLKVVLTDSHHVLEIFIEHFLVAPLIKSYEKGMVQEKQVFLFASSALNLQKNNEHFHLTQHDVLNFLKETYNVIRAMNVLDPSYFSHDDFPKIIQHIYNGLEDTACLSWAQIKRLIPLLMVQFTRNLKKGLTSSGALKKVHLLKVTSSILPPNL